MQVSINSCEHNGIGAVKFQVKVRVTFGRNFHLYFRHGYSALSN